MALLWIPTKRMLVWNREQRVLLADKLSDMANIAAGGLIFGQALGDTPFSAAMALAGLAIWLFISWCALFLAGGSSHE
jgi:hypothetical protein